MEINQVILKILKRPLDITKGVCSINGTVLDDSGDILKEKQPEVGYAFDKNIKSVKISDHAEFRWNTRVGPRTTSIQLKKLLNQLLYNPHRLKKLNGSFGVIDSEILFTYEINKCQLTITSFYGRRSINHSLNQIEALRGYNDFYNEQLNLELEDNVLTQQIMPPLPMTFLEFDGVRTKYYLEGYWLTGKELPIIFVYCDSEEVVNINLNEAPDIHINKSIMFALFLMRYRDFVWKYLQIKYKDRVVRLLNK